MEDSDPAYEGSDGLENWLTLSLVAWLKLPGGMLRAIMVKAPEDAKFLHRLNKVN